MHRRSSNVFAPVLVAVSLAVVAGAAAIVATHEANAYHPSLNVLHPRLADHEPTLNAPPRRLSRRVVLVIIDGLRLQDSFERPALESLRRIGIESLARAHYPTISRPNHAALVTGVPPMVSGVRNNDYSTEVPLDSLMDRARAAGLRSAFAGDYTTSLPYLFGERLDEAYYGHWPEQLVKSGHSILRRDFSLVVLIPGAVDTAGHEHGGDSDEYRQAVDHVDAQLAALVEALDLRQDTLIVTSDHGHTDEGGHGGYEPEVVEVPLILAGAGIRKNGLLGDVELIDVAPTAAALLGLPAPGHGMGRTLINALELDEPSRAALREADLRRISSNRQVHATAIEEAAPERAETRKWRLLVFAGALLAAIGATLLARRLGALHFDWRVLFIAVPAFPLSYYALLDLLGQHVSLSALPDRGRVLEKLFDFGLASTVVQAVAGWIALRGRVVLRDRLAAANALTLAGMLVAWIPAALLWAVYGSGPHVEIPGPRLSLIIPATYVAVATFAISAAVLLSLEIVIFFARAIDPRERLRRLERAAQRVRQDMEAEGE